MVQMTIQSPSFVKESMIFQTERDMFDWYLSVMDEVDFKQESNLSPDMEAKILKNQNKDILYTNI